MSGLQRSLPLSSTYGGSAIWKNGFFEELTKIIEIANEFYDLNNIEINAKKSELLAINSSLEK